MAWVLSFASSWHAGSLVIASLLAMMAGASAQPAGDAAADDTGWPCIQRLVPELAASQMTAFIERAKTLYGAGPGARPRGST